MYELRRFAILVASPSRGNAYLPGAEPDAHNFRAFLRSPNGGAWREDEIIVLIDPGRFQVLQTISVAVADYVVVYFSGHGYTNTYGERMAVLRDGSISDISLLNNSPRQLVIVDACRVHHEGGAAIGAIPWHREQWLNASGYSAARALFDHFINDSAPGKVIIHAAKDNQPAFEDTARRGGRFTLSLLDNVFSRQQEGRYGACYIGDILDEISPGLFSFIQSQQPEVVFIEGFLTVPFAITSPNFHPAKLRATHPAAAPQQSNAGGWLMLAGFAMILYGLSE